MRSKKPVVIPSLPADVDRVHRRLQEWRQRRKHGARIPEALWIASAKLAKKYGAAKVAHALRLDYYGLTQRLNPTTTPDHRSETPPEFIELRPLSSASPCQCSIEIEDRRGGRLKLEFKGLSTVDLAALGRALWSAQR